MGVHAVQMNCCGVLVDVMLARAQEWGFYAEDYWPRKLWVQG